MILLAAILIMALAIPALAADRYENAKAVINATTADDGYVTVKYKNAIDKKLKVIVEKDGGKYTYDLSNKGAAEVYTLQLGSGKYKVRVMENTSGTKYATALTAEFEANIKNEFAPYLVSNQFVKFTASSTAVLKASELTAGGGTDREVADMLCNFVVNLLTYDKEKAKTVQSGYVPNVDEILEIKKGICFDYSSLLGAMLRSQGVPTKLVTGYTANGVYHAWNEIYCKDIGWVKTGEVYFDGTSWKMMDTTFISSSKGKKGMSEFIGDGGAYTKVYEF